MTTPLFSPGNPVDSWWNDLRPHIRQSIERMATSPAFDDAQFVEQQLTRAKAHYERVQQSLYPPQAEIAQYYLLESLEHLCDSLHWQTQSAYHESAKAYQRAYQHFMIFTHVLLQRGIYEPDPTTLQKKS